MFPWIEAATAGSTAIELALEVVGAEENVFTPEEGADTGLSSRIVPKDGSGK